MRMALDNIYSSNQGELIANEGQNGRVDMDQLLSRRAGGVYRTEGDASIVPLAVISSAGDALTALQMTDQIQESRTGVGRNSMGMQADALQNTATGSLVQEEAVNQRLEMISRNYAENFFKPMASYTLFLLSRYHNRDAEVMLKGRPLATRPADWSPDMSVSVSVGLGTGNRAKQAQGLQMVLTSQQAIAERLGPSSPVKLSHIMYTLRRQAAVLGFQDADAFYGTDEETKQAEAAIQAQAAQPQPDPNQALVQIEQAKAESQMRVAQINQQMKAMELEAKRNEGIANVAIEARNEERKHELEVQRLQAELVLEQAKLALLERKTALEMAVKEMDVNNKAALDGRRMEIERELSITVQREREANNIAVQNEQREPQGGM
jgi:hypothetical protein